MQISKTTAEGGWGRDALPWLTLFIFPLVPVSPLALSASPVTYNRKLIKSSFFKWGSSLWKAFFFLLIVFVWLVCRTPPCEAIFRHWRKTTHSIYPCGWAGIKISGHTESRTQISGLCTDRWRSSLKIHVLTSLVALYSTWFITLLIWFHLRPSTVVFCIGIWEGDRTIPDLCSSASCPGHNYILHCFQDGGYTI